VRVVRYYPRALAGDGGMTNAVRMFSHALAGLGAHTLILHAQTVGEPPVEPGVRYELVRHRHVDGVTVPVALERHLAGADVLVLHSAWTVHNVVAATAARRLGVPYVLEPRGAYDPHIFERRRLLKSVFWRLAERAMVLRARAVHVFFDSEVEHLRRLGYGGAVVIAPNGVTVPDSFRWSPGGGDHVLWLGRFDPQHKGLDLLLEAMSLLPPGQRPDVRLQGPDWRGRKRLVADLVTKLHLQRSVSIGPPVYGDDKWRAIADARAFIYPSRWEAFGNSLAEAAHIGVPPAATNYPLAQHLAAHKAAYVSKPEPAALATVLQQVTASSAADTGHRARALVTRTMTWPAVARAWHEQVRELL
jgi:glycosyltransferase involved in cell wall biosynthesis